MDGLIQLYSFLLVADWRAKRKKMKMQEVLERVPESENEASKDIKIVLEKFNDKSCRE